MTFVTDPDDLDRFQVLVNPGQERISIKGLSTFLSTTGDRGAADGVILDGAVVFNSGDTFGAFTGFYSSNADFVTDSISVGDDLVIASGYNAGHYTVASIDDLNTLTINETFLDGGNIATDGDFGTGSSGNWTAGAGWTVDDVTNFRADASASSAALSQTANVGTILDSTEYVVTYEVVLFTAGTVTVNIGGVAGAGRTATGVYVERITTGGSATDVISFTTSGFTGSIDNVLVVPGTDTFTVADGDGVVANGPSGGNVSDGASMQALYSFLKEEFRTLSDADLPDLIKFTFPFESITREQFELGGPTHSNWDFGNTDTRNLIRTGGWAQIDNVGDTQAEYTGIITLGTLDVDAQAYYQQHATTADPIDFVLPGAVNQAINTLQYIAGPDAVTGFAVTGTNTITRNDGGNWITDGFIVGGLVTIRGSENAGENDGTWTILSRTSSVLVVVGTGLTNNAADTTMELAVDKTQFLKLFVRKKARTYVQSEIADIGVSIIETIVNRFPLSHGVDPVITVSDGELAGSNNTGNLVFGEISSQETGSDGVIADVDLTDGLFEFTAASADFATNEVQPGDVIEITGSGSGNDGFYEIFTVDSSTSLTLYEEPSSPATVESSLAWESFTRRSVFERTDGDALDATPSDSIGEFRNGAGANFITLGASVGDYLVITDGGGTSADPDSLIGIYKITAIQNGGATNDELVIDLEDYDNWVTDTTDDVVYEIWQPGMYLQYKSQTAATVGPSASFTWATNVVTRAAGSFITDGYVVGGVAVIATSEQSGNNGTYLVTAVTALTMTLINTDLTTPTFTDGDGDDDGVVINGQNGFVRELNGTFFSFNWRLYGNGGSLSQMFQWLQKELRQTFDIDLSSSTARGDVTDLLMAFSTPTGTTFNLFVDDLASSDFNNATLQDLLEIARNFAFIAGITINLNTNLTTDSSAKVTVFFTNPDAISNGNEFGTAGAIIVQDTLIASMEFVTPLTNPINTTFDFDNNVQGGRVPANDTSGGTPVTIVAVGLETAQYVQVVGTIQRANSNIFSLVSALERNFDNP